LEIDPKTAKDIAFALPTHESLTGKVQEVFIGVVLPSVGEADCRGNVAIF